VINQFLVVFRDLEGEKIFEVFGMLFLELFDLLLDALDCFDRL
jgi:hypothetical protein